MQRVRLDGKGAEQAHLSGVWIAYLRAAAHISKPFPIRLRDMHQPAISTCHAVLRPFPSLLACT